MYKLSLPGILLLALSGSTLATNLEAKKQAGGDVPNDCYVFTVKVHNNTSDYCITNLDWSLYKSGRMNDSGVLNCQGKHRDKLKNCLTSNMIKPKQTAGFKINGKCGPFSDGSEGKFTLQFLKYNPENGQCIMPDNSDMYNYDGDEFQQEITVGDVKKEVCIFGPDGKYKDRTDLISLCGKAGLHLNDPSIGSHQIETYVIRELPAGVKVDLSGGDTNDHWNVNWNFSN